MDVFKGKTGLVTGSTSGIGLRIAEALAARGANVILNGLGVAAEVESLCNCIASQYGVRAQYDGADMQQLTAIEAMIDHAIADFGVIDILVNNAGIQHVAPIEEFPADQWDAIIAINLSASFHTIRRSPS
ncbi:MAG TPA: SDR family NAD(P)-dependent oxidoreductase [Burkholderiales bacterium]|nr:SDR family NAD(P)-dependent oxidoreductase [Burkholderiales bacterium]